MGRPFGYKCSDETKEKMRQKKLGSHQTSEHKKHMSESKMGNKVVEIDGKRRRVYPSSPYYPKEV